MVLQLTSMKDEPKRKWARVEANDPLWFRSLSSDHKTEDNKHQEAVTALKQLEKLYLIEACA